MKRVAGFAALLLCLCLVAGCAAKVTDGRTEGAGVFVAHGYLRGGEGVAELDGARYAFLPKGEGGGIRAYLYELNEEGGKKRIVCSKEGCAHEEQSVFSDPCHAYSYATAGLMASGGALYAGSRNGSVGVTRFDPAGGPPETVLTSDKEIACFLVFDGAIYYAQQDQAFPAGPLAPEGGFRLMRRELGAPDAPAQTVYERAGIGYIGCCQEIGGKLYLTEFTADGEMNIVRVSPGGGDAERFAPDCGGHFIAQVGGRLGVSRRNGDGTWTAVLLDSDGGDALEAVATQASCQVIGAGGCLLVDSGVSLPARERTLFVCSGAGERLGEVQVPAGCGSLLGADGQYAYYWGETAGSAPRLVRLDIGALLP